MDITVKPEVVEHANGILASTDLMTEIVRDAEAHTPGEAVYLHHTLRKVIEAAKEAQAALELHLCTVLEEPIDHAGWQFRKGTTKKRERFDHDEIGKRVIDIAAKSSLDEETGEVVIPDERQCAANAVHMMSEIYLSDSTTAKVTQLDRYGIPRGKSDDSVRHWEKGHTYIDISPIMSEPQE